MDKKVAIIGIGMSKMGEKNKSILELIYEVVKKALIDANIKKEEIDGLFISPEGYWYPNSPMLATHLCEYLNIELSSLSKFECGGTTSIVAFKHAVNEILLKRCKIGLVIGVEKTIDTLPEDMHTFLVDGVMGLTGLYDVYDAPYGIGAPIPYYAMSKQRYMYEYNVKDEEIAKVAVILREHASLNEYAYFRDKITIEDVLSSRMVSPPIRLFECSKFVDGAAAVILANIDYIKNKDRAVFITAIGEYHDPSNFIPHTKDKSITEFMAVKEAAKRAYKDARKTPEDIDVAQTYGVFASTELMILEDLGFFEKGKSAKKIDDIRIDGRIPTDTDGGRLSVGHPAMATPLIELHEITTQLRNEAGQRQVKDAKCGLVQVEHGMLNGSVVIILEK